MSDELPITYGVPQGSVIGPTLFLVYLNDLCQIKLNDTKITAFADDTALSFVGDTWPEVFHKAQYGFNIIKEWLAKNSLTLNTDKTNYMTFSLRQTTQPPPSLYLVAHSCSVPDDQICNCPKLAQVTNTKYLGVTLDNGLSFSLHIELLQNRVRKLIYIFKTLRHVADARLLRQVYFALCQSLLSYCISTWGGAPKTRLLKLERAQRAILKVSNFKNYMFPTAELYKSCQVLTVRQLFIAKTVLIQHSATPYKKISKRRKDIVCVTRKSNLTHSSRFNYFLAPTLYNKLNKILPIYQLSSRDCKNLITKWLQGLTYEETENLLSTMS